ncbi:MAG: septal ring lytic transglycosylase RlpA family protein [Solirubrobacteraceae bacterium]
MSFSTRIAATFVTVLATGSTLAVAADSGGTQFDAAAPAARHAMVGHALSFKGTARPGTQIALQQLDDGAWTTVSEAVADAQGAYVARWRSRHIGVFEMRAVPAGQTSVRASAVEDAVRVTIYQPAVATWFGRGLYGHKTACGQTLSKHLMGVAHKTLPCGTKVSFLYRGRTVTVPVVDRGPFGKGISWDLTTAASDALGFTATGKGTVGAVSLRRR